MSIVRTNALPFRHDLPCHQGDTLAFSFSINEGDERVYVPRDLTDYVFSGKVKTKSDVVVLSLVQGANLFVTPLTGTVTIEITPAQTANFVCGACYYYDVQSIFEGKVKTWVNGTINVSKQL